MLTVPLAVLLTAALVAGCGQVPADPFGAGAAAPTVAVPEPKRSDPPSATPSAASKPSATTPPTSAAAKPKARPTATAGSARPRQSSTPKAKIVLSPGQSGGQVRELQARLKQLDWYSGDVTENYGDKTAAAVKGFQRKRKLPATGTVDETTWTKLTAMTREPTNDELHNVVPAGPPILSLGDQGDKVAELQARLTQLDWFSERVTGYYGDVTAAAVKGFQAKRGLPATGAVDQATWDKLVGMSEKPTDDELEGDNSGGGSAGGLDPRCLTGRAMCIDKTTNQLVWVVDGDARLRFDVRFGSVQTPTREGAFSVGWKAEQWTSTLYDSEMPYSMFFSGGQAVHYSSDFAARGYNGASHGCVNVRDLGGIKTLFSQAQVGDKVIVYRS
jgi:peptidoglycan hydrolase-like protein with peptidoglycan-binding domain